MNPASSNQRPESLNQGTSNGAVRRLGEYGRQRSISWTGNMSVQWDILPRQQIQDQRESVSGRGYFGRA